MKAKMADAMLNFEKGKVSESEDSGKKSTKKSSKQADKKESSTSSRKSRTPTSPPRKDKSKIPVRSTRSGSGNNEKRDKSHDNSTHLDYADLNRPDVDQHGDKPISLNDVMSFLQVMKSNQSKTEKRLNQLSNKVNDLYDYEDYDEDELLRDDGEGDTSLGYTNDNGEYYCDDNRNDNNNIN